jgi:4-amino-4-deoxy-L-arabinose transferase-like glycosyltransferase
VPVHLLAVAFTYTALFVAACAVIGMVLTTAAVTPQWAGVTVAPVALLFGWLPVLALRTTPDDLFMASIFVAVVAGITAGVAWLLPERRRWFVIPVMLAIGAVAVWQRFTATPHHLPGRWLFLADGALALFVGALALAAPPLSRWLHSHSAARIVRTPGGPTASDRKSASRGVRSR